MADSCEHGKEPLATTKVTHFLSKQLTTSFKEEPCSMELVS